MGKQLNRPFTEEETQMANKHVKRYSASFVIRAMQIKTTKRYHYTAFGMGKVQKTGNISHCQDVKEQEMIADGNAK